MGMPATLLAVLVSVGAASREGVTYRRWHNVEGDQVSEIYTDPDYQADSPDHEEVLTAFFETPVNIWYALLKLVDDFTFYSNRHGHVPSCAANYVRPSSLDGSRRPLLGFTRST